MLISRQIPKQAFSTICQMLLFAALLLLAVGCATVHPPTPADAPESAETLSQPVAGQEQLATGYAVVTATPTDTYASLARIHLGDEKLAYLISDFNHDAPLVPGKQVVIPLKPVNPGGLYPDGFQTVPVLCYHQFSSGRKSSSKISVSEAAFDRQMAYLKNNGYQVITLRQFADFIEYRRRPPKKSVLITIDDGWKTVKTIAYPILKKYGFTAVLFVYTDLIKTRQNSTALSWDDLREMVGSGVIEVQSHTVSHTDLTKVGVEQLTRELRDSKREINRRLGSDPAYLAYPYGTFNDQVVDAMQKNGYRAGFTVVRGANPFFNNAWSMNRSMVFNSEKIEDFTRNLETFRRSN